MLMRITEAAYTVANRSSHNYIYDAANTQAVSACFVIIETTL
jgi:hypothetical protein